MNNATDMVLHLLSNENCVDETVSRNIIDAGDVCQFGLGMDEFSAALAAINTLFVLLVTVTFWPSIPQWQSAS